MKKVFPWLLVIVMLVSIVAGCSNNNGGNNEASESPSASAEPSASESTEPAEQLEHVDLTMYLMGQAPKDMDLVMEKLNALIKRDLNATLKINHIPWTDWQQKYNLLMASGEEIDLIYSSNWALFNDQVQKGAFLPLNDLLPQYAPLTWEKMPEASWKEATRDGKIYAVPSQTQDAYSWGVVIRSDLREKYNLPKVDSFETLEQYLYTIKANEKELLPLNLSSQDNWMQLFFAMSEYANVWTTDPSSASMFVTKIDQSDITDVHHFTEIPEFEQFLTKMHDWAQKGYWSKSVLSNKIDSRTSFQEGQSAAAISPSGEGVYQQMKANNPDWELEFWPFSEKTGVVNYVQAMGDGVAVPKSAANPERALMLLDKLRNDEEYYNLTTYGIEGMHYVFTPEGQITLPDGVTSETNGFPADSLGNWGWRVREFMKPSINQWPEKAALDEKYQEYATVNKYFLFQFDIENVKTEMAAIAQLEQAYVHPLVFGIVDPKDGIGTLKEKLKVAGIEKVAEEVRTQVKAYAEEQGY